MFKSIVKQTDSKTVSQAAEVNMIQHWLAPFFPCIALPYPFLFPTLIFILLYLLTSLVLMLENNKPKLSIGTRFNFFLDLAPSFPKPSICQALKLWEGVWLYNFNCINLSAIKGDMIDTRVKLYIYTSSL